MFLNYNADADQLLEILGWKNLQLTASGTYKGHHGCQMPTYVKDEICI